MMDINNYINEICNILGCFYFQGPPLSPKDVLMVEEESREASARLAAISESEEKYPGDIPQLGASE